MASDPDPRALASSIASSRALFILLTAANVAPPRAPSATTAMPSGLVSIGNRALRAIIGIISFEAASPTWPGAIEAANIAVDAAPPIPASLPALSLLAPDPTEPAADSLAICWLRRLVSQPFLAAALLALL